jgi:hypothetical protein
MELPSKCGAYSADVKAYEEGSGCGFPILKKTSCWCEANGQDYCIATDSGDCCEWTVYSIVTLCVVAASIVAAIAFAIYCCCAGKCPCCPRKGVLKAGVKANIQARVPREERELPSTLLLS